MTEREWNRRDLFVVSQIVGTTLIPREDGAAAQSVQASVDPTPEPRQAFDVTLTVNGVQHRVGSLDAHTTLLDCLRDRMHLTGSKKGCGLGHCGACTVLVDGRRVNACLSLAVMQEGRQITTIEGLAEGEALHPVQAAFIEHDGFQCGHCTPGQIMSAVACIGEGHAGSDAEVREWMSGNICRCGAYPNIVAAVREAAGKA